MKRTADQQGLWRRATVLGAVMALAACEGEAPQGPVAPTAVEPGTDAAPQGRASAVERVIPPVFRGRWVLTGADCEAGRADAEGRLAIGPQRLEFYESVGVLKSVEEGAPNRLRATFSFTGEGMEWEREMMLEREGDVLVRQEFGADAAQGRTRYTQCNGDAG